jgi:membrane protein DedA with SNARE-associated domain
MPRSRFLGFNVIGGVIWGAGLPIAGYLLGDAVPGLEQWLVPAAMVLVAVSLVPVWRELRRYEPVTDAALADGTLAVEGAPLDDDADGIL